MDQHEAQDLELAGDDRGAAIDAAVAGQLGRGGIAIPGDGQAEPLGALAVEGGGAAAAARLRLDRSGIAALAGDLADPVDADGEAGGDLLTRAFAGVAGGDGPLA